MEYNELKEFINNLKLVQYWSGDFKTHHRIDIYDDWIFFNEGIAFVWKNGVIGCLDMEGRSTFDYLNK